MYVSFLLVSTSAFYVAFYCSFSCLAYRVDKDDSIEDDLLAVDLLDRDQL